MSTKKCGEILNSQGSPQLCISPRKAEPPCILAIKHSQLWIIPREVKKIDNVLPWKRSSERVNYSRILSDSCGSSRLQQSSILWINFSIIFENRPLEEKIESCIKQIFIAKKISKTLLGRKLLQQSQQWYQIVPNKGLEAHNAYHICIWQKYLYRFYNRLPSQSETYVIYVLLSLKYTQGERPNISNNIILEIF